MNTFKHALIGVMVCTGFYFIGTYFIGTGGLLNIDPTASQFDVVHENGMLENELKLAVATELHKSFTAS